MKLIPLAKLPYLADLGLYRSFIGIVNFTVFRSVVVLRN